MSRVKTFDSTGTPPGGVFYAGDANAIQDQYADLSNFTQTHDVSVLRIGDTSIQLLKYGTAEARISAALRTDGVLRGLSGVAPGTFTTTQRDAIALGSRPYGMIIVNSTTNRLEVNMGSDTTPSWVVVGFDAFPVGSIIPYTGAEGSVPAGWSLADGGLLSRTTFVALNALYSAQTYPFGAGDGSTTFAKPDMRGRAGVGRDNMGGTSANRMSAVNTIGASGGASTTALSITDIPSHDHGGTTSSVAAHSHGGATVGAAPGGSTGGRSAAHTHAMSEQRNQYQVSTTSGVFQSAISGVGPAGTYNNGTAGMNTESADHTHAVFVDNHAHGINSDGAHSHTITAQGGAGSPTHNNLQPYLALNWIVKVL